MTTVQILSLIFVGSIYLYTLYKLEQPKDTYYKDFNIFMFMIILLELITLSIFVNNNYNKCPEYERIENVYKLKQ